MKSKRLLLLLLLAIGLPWVANAQETLTVCDGTTTTSNVPIRSGYGSQSEFIYPASMLSDMEGGTISSVKFFSSSTTTYNYTNNVTVYVEEVASATESSSSWSYNQATATKVYEGTTLSVTNGELVITFSSPYQYNGGNLCFNIWAATSAPNVSYYYQGQSYTCAGWDWSITPPVTKPYSTGTSLPKAEFTYTAGEAPCCPKPKSLTCTGYTATTATFTWTNGGEETQWLLEYAMDENFTNPTQVTVNQSDLVNGAYTLDNNLTTDQQYYARIKAYCPSCDPNYSDWSNTCAFKPSNTHYAVIGTGQTSTSGGIYGGIYTYNNYYAYTQQIYTATELTNAGAIPGVMQEIALMYAETTASKLTFEVYLGQTTATSLSSAWISDADLTKVYEGETTFSGNAEWNSIDVTTITEWEWDGTSNIVVAIRRTDKTSPAVSYPDFYYTSISSMCRYISSSSSNVSLNDSNVPSSGTGTTTTQRPDMKFGIAPNPTPKPRNLQVTEKTSESATLTWEAPANATPMSYLYHYKKATDAYFNQPIDNGNNLSVTLNELAANTEYNFGVYANYSEGMSDYAEITFTTEATCLVPAGLAVNDMVATWTAGTASKWNLQYKRSADATWTSVEGLTAASYDFNNLTLDANKNYDVQVQADCGNNDLSEWSETETFRTPCGIEIIDANHQWSEGFESYNQGTSTNSGAAVTEIYCWERVLVNSSTNSPFVYRNFQSAASTGLASLELKTGTSAVMVALPQFSAPIQNLNVAFNYNRSTTSYTYTAELGYITNVADATTFVKLFDIPTPVTRGNHSTFSQDLYEAAAAANAPAGSRVAIRFASSYQYTSSAPSWNFDDFVVSYVSDCHKPTGLAITDGSITPYGATATWSGTNDSYKVMIGEENLTINADFESNSIPADFTNDATHPWTVVANTHSGAYCAKSGNGDVDSSTSELLLEVNLTADMTLTFSAKVSSESDYDKAYFSIDGTDKINAISGSGSWIDYSYPLTAGTHTLRWYYTKDVSDYGNDDCFYVDDIVITAGVASWTEYTTNALTYTFDNLTPNRTYQVKVKGVCGNEETQATAPESFTTLVACPAPTGLAIAQGYPTAHGVSFTWDYEDGEVYQYALPIGNVTDPSEVNFNTTWYAGEDFPTWSDLSADTDRTFWLRKKCGDNEYSDPVSISFHTPEACPAPTNFDVDDVTAHTATLTWEGTSNEYQVSYQTTAYVDGVEEGFSSNPAGWSFTQGALNADGTATLSGNTSWSRSTSNGVFDTHIYMNMYSTKDYWLITPSMEIQDGYVLSFDMAYTAYSGTQATPVLNCTTHRFAVLISTDDMQHWTILREWNNSGSEYVLDQVSTTGENSGDIDLSTYAGQTAYIAFFGHAEGTTDYDNNFHFDNVAIGTPVPAGEMQYASNITEETVTLQGLLAERKYEAWLIGDCGSEGPSTEAGPISFTTDIACPAPTALTHANVKSNQADLSWTNGGAENWVVAYKKTADENFTEKNLATTDVTIEGSTVKYTLTGLDETTDYTVKVRDNCDASIPGDGMSAWTATTSFTTMAACSVENVAVSDIKHFTANVSWDGESNKGFTVKYRTAAGINGLSEEFTTTSAPTDWTRYSGALNDDGTGPTSTSSGGWSFGTNQFSSIHAYMNMYSTWKYWLVTPVITLPSGATMSFDVAYTAYNSTDAAGTTGTDDRFCVLISTDEKAHWTILREWNNDGTGDAVLNDIPATFQSITGIDLSTYAGQNVYIAFYGGSTQSNTDNTLRIDNVAIGSPVPAGTETSIDATNSPANLANLEAGTKYEVKVVPNCDENLASDWVSFTTVSANEKWFITEGNWGTASNWEPAGAPTISQNVTLKANATIESTCVAEAKSINGTGTGANAYTLTIKDGGKLKHLNSNVRATVEKNIAGYGAGYEADRAGYYLIANPLTSNVTPDAENNHLLSGNYDLYDWSYNPNGGLEWLNYEATPKPFTSLNAGAYGYLYANEAGITLTYTGTINAYTSNKSRYCSIASNPDSYDFPGWYLLGNPYLYDAYLATAGTNGNALPYIKMNTDGDGFENVAAGTPIEPMEGFFYQQATSSGSVYVVTSAPAVESTAKLNMNLSKGNKQLDNAILVFGGDQQLGKFTFRANSSKVYMPVEGKDYAITSVEGQVGEVPVSFKAEKNGSYTLSFTNEEVNFSYLHLIDNMTGEDVNLLVNPSYSFDARTTDYESRFRLVFATGSSATGDNFSFINTNGNLCIFGIEGEATVQVIDILGHVLSSETFSGSYEKKINGAPGVYMIRLVNGNDVKVQKVVVR